MRDVAVPVHPVRGHVDALRERRQKNGKELWKTHRFEWILA